MYTCICTDLLESALRVQAGRKKKEVSSNHDSGFTKDIIRANSPNQVNAARHELSELSYR